MGEGDRVRRRWGNAAGEDEDEEEKEKANERSGSSLDRGGESEGLEEGVKQKEIAIFNSL